MLRIRYLTPDLCVILGSTVCQPSANIAPHPIAMVICLSFTLTLFSAVYSIAMGQYYSVNYLGFQKWTEKFFKDLISFQPLVGNQSDRDPRGDDITNLIKPLNEAIVELEKNLPFEPESYGQFILDEILLPMINLRKFFQEDIERTPGLIRELLTKAPHPHDDSLNQNRDILFYISNLMGYRINA
jgi:hypothetical protein